MAFDLPWIIASLVCAGIGFVYFRYGKRQANIPLIATGVALFVIPYFTSSWILTAAIGAALGALPFLLRWW